MIIAQIGLGYVGLPLALELAKYYQVIGFDISQPKIDTLQTGVDPNGELEPEAFHHKNITFTTSIDDLRPANVYIVAVPTPIDTHKQPDLKPLLSACQVVGQVIKKGDVVCFESTVYPGCTEEDCIPEIEKVSGLRYLTDFKAGYSPERINPGDKVHTVDKIVKVVGACDEETLELLADIYGNVTSAGIHKTPNIKVAEAAKIIENTQRDLNISLMNELSLIFKKMNINTYDVLAAAGTKWNFLKFTPGLVGGHCIGVDPYYLTHKATELGHSPRVIPSGRTINDNMAHTIAKEIIQHLISNDFSLKTARILILGATFKENVNDFRNSKIVDLVKELQSYYLNLEIHDPLVNKEAFHHEYNLTLTDTLEGTYDVVVLAVQHEIFAKYDENFFMKCINSNGLLYDIRGTFRDKVKHLAYLSL
jgi:UDP-N-acetyl-D-glucosamine/UDP-N-acetyl-D-galactosamine dehydrogenase